MRQHRRQHRAVRIRRDAVRRRRRRHLDAADPAEPRLVARGIDTEDLDAFAPSVIDDVEVVLRLADRPQTQALRVEQRWIGRRRAGSEALAVECELCALTRVPATHRARARIDQLEPGTVAEAAEHEPARVRNAREILGALRTADEAMAVARLAIVRPLHRAGCAQDQDCDESGVRRHARRSVRTGTCVSSWQRALTYICDRHGPAVRGGRSRPRIGARESAAAPIRAAITIGRKRNAKAIAC